MLARLTYGDPGLHAGRFEVVRLHGIDAPEKGQPFGAGARAFTAGLAFGKTVVVQIHDRDRYGRTVADVVLPDGWRLNQQVVRAGYAWWFRRYSPGVLRRAVAGSSAAATDRFSEPTPPA